jgi:uncharacterized 2Fe-2S/4Fe-4S cluster protein (DUF4445 family)
MHAAEPSVGDTGRVRSVALNPPDLGDNTGDADRLAAALSRQLGGQPVALDVHLLGDLPRQLRQNHWHVQCVLCQDRGGWDVVAVRAADSEAPFVGLAVDLGTSRVALRLVDLLDGRHLMEDSFTNPQIGIGADVLTRIHFAAQPGGSTRLQRLIVDGLNDHLQRLCHGSGIRPDRICLLTVAGNTAMTHLFLGADPRWMIREPYIPAINRPAMIRSAELGLPLHPGCRVLVFPNVGSYLGGDLIAGLLFLGMHRRPETAILVDVGTNAEVVMGNNAWMMGCAGAAGPALEGGAAAMGMMAGPGVIDRITVDQAGGNWSIHTIGNHPPIGICGSGLIDLTAALFRTAMIDQRGKIVPEACGGRFRCLHGMGHIVVVPAEHSATGAALTVSQADLDSLIRAKAAMYTVLETLAITVGLDFKDLSAFYVAGTFGALIDPVSAVAIGMLPDLPLGRFKPVGNTSLEGATLALTSPAACREIATVSDRITYLELNVNPEFMNRFSAATFLPHTDRRRFPSVSRP